MANIKPCFRRNNCSLAFLIIPFLLIGLMGCSPLVRIEQPQHTSDITLDSNSSVGQTFLTSYDGLNSIILYIIPGEQSAGDIVLNIWEGPGKNALQQTASIPLNRITRADFYKFTFPEIEGSFSQDYYLEAAIDGDGDIGIGLGPGENYQNGSAYSDGRPLNKQLAFRLTYGVQPLIIGFGNEILSWVGYILLSIFLFILPGWALLMWLYPRWEKISWFERLALATGSSLAFYPIFILWSNLIGLNLGRFYSWIPPLVGLTFIIWKQRKKIQVWWSLNRNKRAHQNEFLADPSSVKKIQKIIKENLQELLLLFLLGLMIVLRYWNIRLLDVPLWGDSYQHTMIAQLIVDNQGIPNSWLPYVPYRSLTVHYGFPLSVALLQWITDLPNTIATLYFGQVLNIVAVLSLYPLAVRMSGGKRWAGVGAVLFAGLFSPTPAFYTNWGRYAQLAGQAILPIALWFFWDVLDKQSDKSIKEQVDPSSNRSSARLALLTKDNLRKLLICGMVIAGMTLTYYRMPFYFGTFAIAWLVTWGVNYSRGDLRNWTNAILEIAAMVGISILLFLPWALRLSGSILAGAIEAGVTAISSQDAILQDFQAWNDISLYIPIIVLFLVILAAFLSLILKRRLFLSLFLWFFFLVAFKAGQLIRLPGANMIQNFALIIALYLPVSLLLGWMFGTIVDYLINSYHRIGQILVALSVILLGIWGMVNQRNIIDGETFALVTRPDLNAMEWIRNKSPQDSRFLVEGFRIYNGNSAVGSDAGWWISLLTGRQNSMPPQYALLSEIPITPNYSKDIVSLVAGLEKNSINSEIGLNLLCDNDVTHIFIGQGQGKVGYGAMQLFSPDTIAENQAYHLIYHQDRVYMYEIDPQLCRGN